MLASTPPAPPPDAPPSPQTRGPGHGVHPQTRAPVSLCANICRAVPVVRSSARAGRIGAAHPQGSLVTQPFSQIPRNGSISFRVNFTLHLQSGLHVVIGLPQRLIPRRHGPLPAPHGPDSPESGKRACRPCQRAPDHLRPQPKATAKASSMDLDDEIPF